MALFLKCIQTQNVFLKILDNTWSTDSLEFLMQGVFEFEYRSKKYNTFLAFDPKTLKDAIITRRMKAERLAGKIMDSHNKIYHRLPNEDCHLCGKDGGHSIKHYTNHVRCGNNEDLETQGHLSRKNCGGCKRRMVYYTTWRDIKNVTEPVVLPLLHTMTNLFLLCNAMA